MNIKHQYSEQVPDTLVPDRWMVAYQELLFLKHLSFFNELNTFELLLLCKSIIYQDDKQILATFASKYRCYTKKYPDAYQFSVDPPGVFSSAILCQIILLFVRRQAQYRWFDRFLFNALTCLLYRIMCVLLAKELPDFVDNKAMPLDKLLR